MIEIVKEFVPPIISGLFLLEYSLMKISKGLSIEYMLLIFCVAGMLYLSCWTYIIEQKKTNIERLKEILEMLSWIGVILSFLFFLILVKKISFEYDIEILCIIASIEILILESFKLFGNE